MGPGRWATLGGRADDEVDPTMTGALVIVAAFAAMWAVIILPQQRKARRHDALVASLVPGDEVVTAGGIVGTIVELDGDDIVLEAVPGAHLRLVRAAVGERRRPADARRDVPAPVPGQADADPGEV